MSRQDYLFTSESVSEGHPDKVCDRISDAVVDLYLAADPFSRVACETMVTTNRIVMAGEVRGPSSVTADAIEEAARRAEALLADFPTALLERSLLPANRAAVRGIYHNWLLYLRARKAERQPTQAGAPRRVDAASEAVPGIG